ncbi:glycosyltransferase [Lithospermum erythrorhizon]|uniref:Glycosyltransferase n=1 Tax=Lithospermum erythrorhizon TaxID=34254 RepID=A0AAV3S2Q6_LITER
MPKKSFFKPKSPLIFIIFFAFLFILTLYFTLFNTPFHNSSTNDVLGSVRVEKNGNFGKVRIFMYDLPRKFTYGVVESYAKARGGVKEGEEGKYPGNQHMGEWHLFRDLNRVSDERGGSAVVRVMDPEKADLFYVPFFSSLSLVANPIRPGDPEGGRSVVDYSDEEMQEELVQWLEEQIYWKRNNGWDHVFICQDPNALYKVVDRVKNGILLVSDFGRLSRTQASLVKDVILPYAHRINTYNGEVGIEDRNTLLFFMGQRFRKEGGKVRDMLFKVLEKEKDVLVKHGTQSRESRREATRGMHTSKFCLHPAGDTPSACRLFDAIVSLCIPVIVSDYIELPFEDVIDYRKIAVFVDTKTAIKPGYLVLLLRKVKPDRILNFQKELRKVKRYFDYDDPDGTVNEIWRQVSLKLPLVKLMINRDNRLVLRNLPEPDCSCLCSNQSGIHTTL